MWVLTDEDDGQRVGSRGLAVARHLPPRQATMRLATVQSVMLSERKLLLQHLLLRRVLPRHCGRLSNYAARCRMLLIGRLQHNRPWMLLLRSSRQLPRASLSEKRTVRLIVTLRQGTRLG